MMNSQSPERERATAVRVQARRALRADAVTEMAAPPSLSDHHHARPAKPGPRTVRIEAWRTLAYVELPACPPIKEKP